MLINITKYKLDNFGDITKTIPLIISSRLPIIFNTCYIFPKGFFVFFISMTIAVHNIKNDNKNININFLIIVLISILASFSINFFTTASMGSARLLFPIGALIGNIYIILYVKTNDFETKVIKSVLTFMLILYFLVTIINYMYIIYNHKKVEELNEQECSVINSYLKKYEKDNNIKLKKIVICYDEDITYFYKKINNYSSLCHRPLARYWSIPGSINYYTGMDLKEIDIIPPEAYEVYEKYFKNKNWEALSEEHIVYIEDTVYYCVY